MRNGVLACFLSGFEECLRIFIRIVLLQVALKVSSKRYDRLLRSSSLGLNDPCEMLSMPPAMMDFTSIFDHKQV